MKLESLPILAAALIAAAPTVLGHQHQHHHHRDWKTDEDNSLVANQVVHELEKMYIEDCQADTTPHGYYGAFLQPCEFQFRKSAADHAATEDACSDENSVLVSRPIPMHWFFNLTDHFERDDWDSMSSDDIPTAEELMLWPDQCVGVTPRCYAIVDMPGPMKDTLARLFTDGIPEEATHVQVDCRGDAVQLSRVVYSLAGGLEKSAPTLIAWMVTVILLSTVLVMWSIYACLRLCFCACRRRDSNTGGSCPANQQQQSMIVPGKIVSEDYEILESHSDEGTEKETLLQKN